MTESEHLKLVVLYDATRNEYSILTHNQSAEEAQRFVNQWEPHFKPGYSLILRDQRKRHRIEDAQGCRTCRDIVARTANISPKPKFKRKESQK